MPGEAHAGHLALRRHDRRIGRPGQSQQRISQQIEEQQVLETLGAILGLLNGHGV
jgi:hypothetical protein